MEVINIFNKYSRVVILLVGLCFQLFIPACAAEEKSAVANDNLFKNEAKQDALKPLTLVTPKIKEIQIEGNNLVKPDLILQAISIKQGDDYNKDSVQQVLKQIYETGYFSEKIRALPVKTPDEQIILKIYVDENIPITGYTVEGNTTIPNGEIIKVLEPLKGQPQNVRKINEAINSIEELYASKGFILNRVKAVSDDPDGYINFEISEGVISTIEIEGNKKTKDFVVQRNILSKPGAIYNENTIKADLARLYGTQAFKDVNRTLERVNDDEADLYKVTINLEEQRTGTVSLGGGVDTATGLFATLGFADNNFRGLGQRIALNLMSGTGIIMSDQSMLDRANIQAELSFFEPRLRGSENSLNNKIFYRDFASYQVPLAIERRYGVESTISHQFKKYPNVVGQFSLGAEKLHVREGDFNRISTLYANHGIPISERAKQLEGGIFLGMSPALIYDTRDTVINPRNGVLASLRLDENIGLDGLDKTHGKLTASIKRFFPVAKKSSFSLSARAGGILHGNVPEAMAFRLGGPYTIRGFRMSEVGTGEGFMMASAELLTPPLFLDRIEKVKFFDNIRLAFFVDAGEIFKGSITDTLYNRPGRAISTGVGLRLFVPGVGPLSVDWGYPLTGVGTGNSRGAFTFGVGEFY